MKIDELVETYIKAREKKQQLKAEFDAKLQPYEQLLAKIEALLISKLDEMGADSIKTSAGTAYLSVRTSAGLADWDSFKAFCTAQEDPFEFIERRVSKSAVEAFKAANEDLPPGVNWTAVRTVNFRRT